MNIEVLKDCFVLLSKRLRRDWLVVLFLGMASSVVELIGVTAIVPLISLIVDFEHTIDNKWLSAIYSYMGSPPESEFILIVAGITVLVVVISALVVLANTYASHRFGGRVTASISSSVFKWYQWAPIEFIEEKSQAEYYRSIEVVSKVVSQDVILNIQAIVVRLWFLVVVCFFLLLVNVKVTVVVMLVIGGAYSLIFLFLRPVLQSLTKKNFDDEERVHQLIVTSHRAAKQIRVKNYEDWLSFRFGQVKGRFAKRAADFEIMATVPKVAIETFGLITLLGVSVMIASEDNSASFLISNLAVFAVCAYRTLPAAQQLYHGAARLSSALRVYGGVMDDWGKIYQRYRDEQEENLLIEFDKKLSVEGLSYKYPGGDRYVFDNLNLKVELSGCILLKSFSGSGKSTLLELILGIREQSDGMVKLGGVNINHANARNWRSNVSYIPQEYYLFGGDIRENIVGENEFNEGRLSQVIKVCGLDKVLDRKGEDLSDLIGENASTFSGGERTRIAIASALYEERSVMIIDESLSSLDYGASELLLESIIAYRPELVIIVVSHQEIGVPHKVISLD